ncbi:MAG: nuclear transport factor 2 family protein [Halobacterium sp.]
MTAESNTTPEAVVGRQTEAYNDQDVDAFVSCYAEDAVIASIDGERVADGHDEIREEYEQLFEAVPDLRCEVTDEFTVDDYVVCRERVTGTGEPITAVAVYLVEDGAIRRLWLADDR